MQPSFFTGPFAPMCEKFVAQQRSVKNTKLLRDSFASLIILRRTFMSSIIKSRTIFLRLIAKNVQRKMTIHAEIGFI